MLNIYQIFGKVLLSINVPLPVLPGNEQDLGHGNIHLVNTYLFYQEWQSALLETSLPMYRSYDILASDIPKTDILDGYYIITKSLPNL